MIRPFHLMDWVREIGCFDVGWEVVDHAWRERRWCWGRGGESCVGFE